jgi:hypothetical protein
VSPLFLDRPSPFPATYSYWLPFSCLAWLSFLLGWLSILFGWLPFLRPVWLLSLRLCFNSRSRPGRSLFLSQKV